MVVVDDDGDDEEVGGRLLPCPVCTKMVAGSSINEHLDACLKTSSSG